MRLKEAYRLNKDNNFPSPITYITNVGGDPSGAIDSTSSFQQALDTGGAICINGSFYISDTLLIEKPIHLFGYGNTSKVIVSSAMSAETDIFEINPLLTADKYQWTIEDFYIEAESGTPARHVFHIDITTANKFLAKNKISNVRADKFGGDYLHLTNPSNVDGLFTSQYSDNFCFNGIELENSGDSLIFERNTHTGASIGPAFTIDQIGTASHIVISRSNSTASGGVLSIKRGRNIILQDTTCECPNTFDGDNNALVSVDGKVGPPIVYTSNTKILNNNLNTQGNVTRCIYVDYSSRTTITGNTLFCDPATDVHIYIDTNAYNTIVGENNRFLTSVTGAETTPLITDNGTGTMGILKPYTITLPGWALIDAANNHPAEFIKDADGMVTLFGALDGPSTAVAATLFTLPLGFRPKKIVKFWTHERPGNSYLVANDMFDNNASAAVTPVSDIQTPFDGNVTNLPEVTGAPGIDLSVNFTGVTKIIGVVLRAYYFGSSSHYVNVSLHNYTSGNEDVVIRLDHSTDHNYRTILTPSDTNYISSGSAQINFIHPITGNNTHDLYIDYVALITSTSTNGTPQLINILPTGQVQTPNGGATEVYLDGFTFHSDFVTV